MADLLLNLYKRMRLIRTTEEEIIAEYHTDEMKTPMHMSMGSEAISAAIAEVLGQNAHYFMTYRSHGLYLAVTGDTDGFFGEMYGKVTGVSRGKAGSMHLASPEHGLMATSAVVGTTIPLALGDAFAAKYTNSDRIAVALFGDGAVDEGVFWEALNTACLMRLPILFVCEDNGLAIHTHKDQRRGYQDLIQVIRQFQIIVDEDIAIYAEGTYNTIKSMVSKMQTSNMPGFINLTYYRYLEHVGVNEDFNAGYRSRDEYMKWLKKDPLTSFRLELVNKGHEKEVQATDEEILAQVRESIAKAKAAPFPDDSELFEGVFHVG